MRTRTAALLVLTLALAAAPGRLGAEQGRPPLGLSEGTGVCEGEFADADAGDGACVGALPRIPRGGSSVQSADSGPLPGVPCYDEHPGPRVRVLVTRPDEDRPPTAAERADAARFAAETDRRVAVSADDRGGTRHIRFDTEPADGGCRLRLGTVVVSDGASFSSTVRAARHAGVLEKGGVAFLLSDYAHPEFCGSGHTSRTTPYTDPVNGPGANSDMLSIAYAGCWGGDTGAHELMHNAGAVQRDAPDSDGEGHCTVRGDLMCRGYWSQNAPAHCEGEQIDCLGDMYFNPTPAAGSYLAANWNNADSPLLAPTRPDGWGAAPDPDATRPEPQPEPDPEPEQIPEPEQDDEPAASPSPTPASSPTATPTPGPTVVRVGADPDPVAAAVDIAGVAFPDGDAPLAVIARSDDYPDALAGSAVSSTFGPLLLHPPSGTDDRVLTEVARTLGGPQDCSGGGAPVYLLGGTQAVPAELEDALTDAGQCPVRVAGADRTATSAAAAEVVLDRGGDTVLLARADGWADAVTGGAWAAHEGHAIAVTWGDELAAGVEKVLAGGDIARVAVLGGDTAVSAEVAAAAAEHADVFRLEGDDRTATAAAIQHEWTPSPTAVTVIDGYAPTGWTGALAAGPLSALRDAPQLHLSGGNVPGSTRDALDVADEVILVGDIELPER